MGRFVKLTRSLSKYSALSWRPLSKGCFPTPPFALGVERIAIPPLFAMALTRAISGAARAAGPAGVPVMGAA